MPVRFCERPEGKFLWATRLVVLCRSSAEADAALAEVRAWVAANGLRLHPDKTCMGDNRQAGQGFDFFGYRFEAGNRGRYARKA
ncbi:MAG: hypothetical protein ACRERU_00075 [Methylococcales bacterium]